MFEEKNNLLCPISKNNDFEELFTIEKFPIFMGVVEKNYKSEYQNLTFNICKSTGTVQIFPRIPLDKLYFKSHGSGKIGKIWNDHHHKFHSIIKEHMSGTIIEIGGGHNSIHSLPIEYNNKFKILSFDPNGDVNNNDNLKVINKFFSEEAIIEENISSVELFIHSHLLEHIYDPLDFLNLIHKYLKKDGLHIFSVPNMKKMIESGYPNAMNFEHPFFLEEDLIDKLLSVTGFEIVTKFYFREDHSIMYTTKKTAKSSYDLDNHYHENKKLFLNLLDKWNSDVSLLNNLITSSKEKIFLFGAHIFSQNLLFLGLNKEKINCILDNDPDKQDSYMYGTNLIVKNPKILEDCNKPIIILRTGAYNSEIKKGILEINSTSIFI